MVICLVTKTRRGYRWGGSICQWPTVKVTFGPGLTPFPSSSEHLLCYSSCSGVFQLVRHSSGSAYWAISDIHEMLLSDSDGLRLKVNNPNVRWKRKMCAYRWQNWIQSVIVESKRGERNNKRFFSVLVVKSNWALRPQGVKIRFRKSHVSYWCSRTCTVFFPNFFTKMSAYMYSLIPLVELLLFSGV